MLDFRLQAATLQVRRGAAAARSAKVLNARWSEIDLEGRMWNVPAHDTFAQAIIIDSGQRIVGQGDY